MSKDHDRKRAAVSAYVSLHLERHQKEEAGFHI